MSTREQVIQKVENTEQVTSVTHFVHYGVSTIIYKAVSRPDVIFSFVLCYLFKLAHVAEMYE